MTDEPENEPRAIFDDLLTLPVSDPLATANGYIAQAYALLTADKVVLVDAAYDRHRSIIDELVRGGRTVAAVVITHHHVLGEGAILRWLHAIGAPILLHPLDVEQGLVKVPGTRFDDPTKAPGLADLGLDVTHFPGHTPGHVLLYWRAHGGVVITGDSAMGPNHDERRAGLTIARRPPPSFNEDNTRLRANWAAFDRPAANLLPLHGHPIVDQAEQMPAILASLRKPEPTPEFVH
jgi:glyoxylase-like metal-dependent hydrolase (beta-lactamase superfamily II)